MMPLCFILMPFGKKQIAEVNIDFDKIYDDLIRPAVLTAGMEPIRADEEMSDGIIHKAMFERLVLCDFAIADLTGANANVFYELGVRHAIKPHTTVLLFSDSTRLPFDVTFLRAFPYKLNEKGLLQELESVSKRLVEKLLERKKEKTDDSPLFQLLDNYPSIDHEKTDVFREKVEYSKKLKSELLTIRNGEKKPAEKLVILKEFETKLGDLNNIEAGVIVDLFLTYRAVKAHEEMVQLFKNMPKPISATILVREQLGFALNRLGKRNEAEQVLKDLISERGPSSETCGILGRVYKDQWEAAISSGDDLLATGFLHKAINAYKKGFETDWRDAYPGVNACTLLYVENPKHEELKKILPVVRYAVTKKIEKHQGGDYWDQATLFELDILEGSIESAKTNLADTIALVREPWEAETTQKNLTIIRKQREKAGDDVSALIIFEKELEKIIKN